MRIIKSNTTVDFPDYDYASAEAKLRDIHDRIYSAGKQFMISSMGFPEDEVTDYFFVDVDFESEMIKVEVRAELSYRSMCKLQDALDPIIQKFDRDAYFEQETSGIMSAFLDARRLINPKTRRIGFSKKVSGEKVTASVCDEYFNYTRSGTRFGVHVYNNNPLYPKFQITEIHPYDDADYAWARCGYEGAAYVEFIKKGKDVDSMQLWCYEEEDYEDESEYWRDIIDAVAVELIHLNANVEPRMMYN